ncbi:MAG: hypothetical protein Q4F31_02050 [Eubacteriales bacterium]|nr:hypothetical protein [Eubacteriales bacterium]
MIENTKKKKKVVLIISALWWALSFLIEPLIFDVSARSDNIIVYLCAKLLCFCIFTLIITFLYDLVEGIVTGKRNLAVRSALYAIPIWVLVSALWLYRGAEIGGEEGLILENAARYDMMNGIFTYITPLVDILLLMTIPSFKAAMFLKIFFLGLDGGYVIARITECFNVRFVPLLIYAAFVTPPAVLQSYSVHRSPIYGMLYLFLSAKLMCDWKEEKSLDRKNLIMAALSISLLTWWRSEGIYFFVLGPIAVFLAYRVRLSKRNAAGLLAVIFGFQAIVYLPKTAAPELTIENYEKHQLTPFYNYALTGMLINGLDRNENADILSVTEEYMKTDFIDILYSEYGEHIYDEGYATYDMYHSGVNREATEEILDRYEKNVLQLIINNPLLFLKAQVKAFSHISTHYSSLCLSSVFGNLWILVLWLIALLVWSAVKKKWFLFVLTLCPICHGCITTLFLPAAYFKYYYPEFLYGWFTLAFVLSGVVEYLKKKRNENGK